MLKMSSAQEAPSISKQAQIQVRNLPARRNEVAGAVSSETNLYASRRLQKNERPVPIHLAI
jgi:hypothetical protein